MERILELLNTHLLWQALVLILLALILTALILWGKAIFHLSFYRSYRIVEIHEIEVPEELQEKVFGKLKVEGKILHLKNHVVKRKIRKKRFEL